LQEEERKTSLGKKGEEDLIREAREGERFPVAAPPPLLPHPPGNSHSPKRGRREANLGQMEIQCRGENTSHVGDPGHKNCLVITQIHHVDAPGHRNRLVITRIHRRN
jgi:hypothetical protein